MSRRSSTPRELAERVLEGEVRAAARVISLFENQDPAADEVSASLFPHTGRAKIIGVTGAPGAGKSTLISRMITAYRGKGRRVGVLAVDPSSPFKGGALLGDRIRMGDHASDPAVFLRSMATRGHLGGLAVSTPSAVRVLDAMGFEVVIVETVGVGQSEVAVAGFVDCTVLVLVPTLGDGIQVLKAGVMEIGDVFAINKSDLPGVEDLKRELQGLASSRPEAERPRVLLTRAATGEGVEALVGTVEERLLHAEETGALEAWRLRTLEAEIAARIEREAGQRVIALLGPERWEALKEDLRGRRLDPGRIAKMAISEAFSRSDRGTPTQT